MPPDYDLSNLQTWQADLWIRLQVGALHAEIFAAQAERLGFPLALGAGRAANSWNRWIETQCLGGSRSFDH